MANVADVLDFRVAKAEFPESLLLMSAVLGVLEWIAYQTTSEVYKTKPATTTVKIKPGTRPNTEYEYGNDMIAKQMYSEKSRAAVWYTD